MSVTARRHGISRSLLPIWQRTFEARRSSVEPAFVPTVVSKLGAASERTGRVGAAASSDHMVIMLGRGRRVVVDAAVDVDALARVLGVLERR